MPEQTIRTASCIDTIADLESKLPKEIEVTTFASSSDSLMMTFSLPTKEDVAALIVNLRKVENFSNVIVTAVTEEIEENKDTHVKTSKVNSQVTCIYGVNPYLQAEEEAAAAE